MKKFLSSLLSLVMVFSLTTTAFAADITTSGGSNEVPVELTQAASEFSVTVPTVLPVDVDADGVVTVATDNKIINNSYGPVEIKSVSVVPQNEWELVAFDTDFAEKKVGLSEFGFAINDTAVATDGSCDAEFAVIDGGSEIGFTYDANVAAQKVKLEDVEIAQVVFTVGWAEADGVVSTPTTYAATFADNSWSEIIDAVQNDAVPDSWSVGDTKAMTINGSEYNVQIIGKDHDTYTGGGTAPLTFQLVETYATTAQMNSTNTNSTGWSGSAMRTTTLPEILSGMPSEVQSAIKSVDKVTIEGYGKNSSAPTTLETTSDKLFLLSESEVFGSTTYSGGVAEGSRYAFYTNGGSAVKTGGSTYWWLRGPHYSNNGNFSSVYSNGNLTYDGAYNSIGVAFGFCF